MNSNLNNPTDSHQPDQKILTSFRIEKNLHQKMKIAASTDGMTMQGFMKKAIIELMESVQSRQSSELYSFCEWLASHKALQSGDIGALVDQYLTRYHTDPVI